MASQARLYPNTRPISPSSSAVSIAGLLAGVAALLVIAALVGFHVANWDKVTPGVMAMGVPVGGLSREEVVTRLRPNIDSLLNRPLQIRYGERVWDTTARDLGLRLDPTDLSEQAYRIGREGNPVARLSEQLGALVSGRTVTVGSRTDQAALESSITGIAREVDRSPQDARLVLTAEGTVQYAASRVGITVDVPASRDRVAEALAQRSASVDLVIRETQPAIGDELVRPAREQLDRVLGSTGAPLTLTFGQREWPLQRPDVIKLLTVEGGTRPGQPATLKIDERPLRALAHDMALEIASEVQEARFNFVGGSLKVLRESREGRKLDEAATVALIKDNLLAGERRAALPVAVVRPAVSSEDPAALGIVELIDRGNTSFAGSIPEKKHNIQLAAERINGAVVPPGGTFSFNKEVGPTTLDAGFKWGFGITSGESGVKTVPSVAGGICQVATTLFQPVFWSGYQLEERYWHLYWIPAYTSRNVVGLDVTVDADSNLDFKWINPTDDYVLVQAAADDTNVYFSLYGKKPAWKVEVDPAAVSNRTPPDPKPVAQEEPTLAWGRTLPVETAREGFDVTVTRRVIASGGEPRVLNLRSTYQPSHNVTLVGTAGKPASASVEDVIRRITNPSPTAGPTVATAVPTAPAAAKTAEPIATPSGGRPTAEATVAPAREPTSAPAAKPTSAPTAAAKPTNTPAQKPQPTPRPTRTS